MRSTCQAYVKLAQLAPAYRAGDADAKFQHTSQYFRTGSTARTPTKSCVIVLLVPANGREQVNE